MSPSVILLLTPTRIIHPFPWPVIIRVRVPITNECSDQQESQFTFKPFRLHPSATTEIKTWSRAFALVSSREWNLYKKKKRKKLWYRKSELLFPSRKKLPRIAYESRATRFFQEKERRGEKGKGGKKEIWARTDFVQLHPDTVITSVQLPVGLTSFHWFYEPLHIRESPWKPGMLFQWKTGGKDTRNPRATMKFPRVASRRGTKSRSTGQ